MQLPVKALVLAVSAAIFIASAPPACAQTAPAVRAAERTAIYKAAGAVQRGGTWLICTDEPNPDPAGATIDEVRDLNGDGRPEAIVIESGSFCYGFTGTGFQLLSQQANGAWKRITGDIGIAEPLKTRGKDGWPDLSIGGPGFCFPVQRWNGREYVVHRHEYMGKACKPG